MSIQILPIKELPIIKKGDDLAKLIISSTLNENNSLQDGDIIVVCHVIVSRAEGNVIDLNTITPSIAAQNYAEYR